MAGACASPPSAGRPAATRVAVYARVSTADQSCEPQLHDLRQYVAARGWEAAEYADQGVSGARDRRPALDRLLAAVKARKVDVVVVAAFDRFGRSVRHLVETLDLFRHLGVEFIAARADRHWFPARPGGVHHRGGHRAAGAEPDRLARAGRAAAGSGRRQAPRPAAGAGRPDAAGERAPAQALRAGRRPRARHLVLVLRPARPPPSGRHPSPQRCCAGDRRVERDVGGRRAGRDRNPGAVGALTPRSVGGQVGLAARAEGITCGSRHATCRTMHDQLPAAC